MTPIFLLIPAISLNYFKKERISIITGLTLVAILALSFKPETIGYSLCTVLCLVSALAGHLIIKSAEKSHCGENWAEAGEDMPACEDLRI